MAKYRKKTRLFEAELLTEANIEGMMKWCNGKEHRESPMRPVIGVEINQMEGIMVALFGDYIMKSEDGEFWPCKPDHFPKWYEKVED